MNGRRGLLLAAVLGTPWALGGCGFRPLYLPATGGTDPTSGFDEVYVPVIGERNGQLLRQALQRRMDSGNGVPKKYELIASAQITGEGIAIQADSSSTRVRLNGTGNWALRRLDLVHTVLASGSSRATDGFNIVNAQYFAADLEQSAASRRVIESLADQIAQQVAIWLRRQPAPPA